MSATERCGRCGATSPVVQHGVCGGCTPPDFERLRAERDAGLERIARSMWEKLGGDPGEAPTFHCREYHSPCYCACPDGPCEHDWDGSRDIAGDDGTLAGWETCCTRCGEGAMHHSMAFLP